MKNTNKNRLKTFLLSLTFILSSSACSNKNYNDKNILNNALNEKQVENIDEEKQTEENMIEEIIEYLNNSDIPYPYNEYYLSEEDIDNLLKYADSTTYCNCNDDINVDNLIDNIISNTNKYIKSHSEYVSALPNDSTCDIEYFQNLVLEDLELILYEILNDDINDVKEDFCKLKDISIVVKEKSNNDNELLFVIGEYIKDENVIVLYYDTLKKFSDSDNYEFSDLLNHTLKHEINHVRQFSCDHRLEKGQLYENLKYQDNHICTLIESSAESEIYALDNNLEICTIYGDNYNTSNTLIVKDYDYTYMSEREDESLLLMLNLFKPDKTIEDYYEAIYDSDYQKFFDFFNVKTSQDAKELMDIIYNIDTLNFRTNFAS